MFSNISANFNGYAKNIMKVSFDPLNVPEDCYIDPTKNKPRKKVLPEVKNV